MAFVTLVYSRRGGVALESAVLALGSAGCRAVTRETYLALVAIGLISQVVGHTGFNWAVRDHLPDGPGPAVPRRAHC